MEIALVYGEASYSDAGLESGTAYYYKVRSYYKRSLQQLLCGGKRRHAGGRTCGPYGNGIVGKRNQPLMERREHRGTVLLHLHRPSENGPWTEAAYISETSYTNTGLTSGTTCWYKVRAFNNGVYSADSAVVSATARDSGLFIKNDSGLTELLTAYPRRSTSPTP